MYKNVASQKVAVYAWDGAAGTAKTGDAANITAEISKDGAASAATDDANPTELDATDHPGVYLFDMTQAETNADLVIITPASSTADVIFRPVIIYTRTPVAGIADAVWDEDISLAQHATANSAGLYMKQLWYSIVTRVAQCGDAGTATTIDLDSGASAVDDYYKGQLIAIILGTGIGQARAITAYNGTTKIATVGPAWATAPDGDSYFAVLNTGSSVVASGALTAGQFLALK